jgi:hypothetical protein
VIKSGVPFYAFFGLGWLLAGLGHYGGTATGVAGTLGLAIALTLVLLSRKLSFGQTIEGPDDLSATTRRQFGLINVVQWGLIASIVVACRVGGQPGLIMPLVAVVVGLHFLPLARVFADPRLIAPGAVLTAVGVTGLIARAVSVSQAAVFTLVGVGCALTLWLTAGWMIVAGKRELPPVVGRAGAI